MVQEYHRSDIEQNTSEITIDEYENHFSVYWESELPFYELIALIEDLDLDTGSEVVLRTEGEDGTRKVRQQVTEFIGRDVPPERKQILGPLLATSISEAVEDEEDITLVRINDPTYNLTLENGDARNRVGIIAKVLDLNLLKKVYENTAASSWSKDLESEIRKTLDRYPLKLS